MTIFRFRNIFPDNSLFTEETAATAQTQTLPQSLHGRNTVFPIGNIVTIYYAKNHKK